MSAQLYINGSNVELTEGIPFPLTFSNADIKDPTKRKRSHSKTITIMGTAANMAIFSSTYQLSLSTLGGTSLAGFNYDPTQRVEAKYYKDGVLVFDGLFQLDSVKIINGVYSFSGNLYSNFLDIFTTLDKVKCSELDWSEYDHGLTRTNIKNSWDTSVVQNGSPVSNFSGSNPDGFGYLYPLAQYGFDQPTPTTWYINQMIPHVYVKETLEKLVDYAQGLSTDLSIDGTWISSQRVKNLVWGYGGGEIPSLPPSEISKREVDFNGDYTRNEEYNYSYIFYPNAEFTPNRKIALFDNEWYNDTVITDELSQYDSSTGIITIAKKGKYDIITSGTIRGSINFGSMTNTENNAWFVCDILVNGSKVFRYGNAPQGSEPATLDISRTVTRDFEAGDTVKIVCHYEGKVKGDFDATTGVEPITVTYDHTTATVDLNIVAKSGVISDGDTVQLSNYIPEMKGSDFFRSIITMFNLYISDPNEDGEMFIQPLTDYFLPTSQFDNWSDKLDYSQEIEISPSSTIEGKNYLFEWAKDTDFDNERYLSNYGVKYGDYNYEVQSTFKTGEKVFKVNFAQSVPIEIGTTGIVTPRIAKIQLNASGEAASVNPHKGKPRIYFYNGLKSGNWMLRDVDNLLGFENLTTYPSIHHLDDYENPTIDLNFGIPIIVYYSATTYTLKTLFTEYHEVFIKEITGRDSKILKAKFKLTVDDVYLANFRRLKMIDGVLFRLNIIEGFDPDITESSTVELIRIIEGDRANSRQTAPPVNLIVATPTDGGGGDTNEDTAVLRGGSSDSKESNILYG